MHSRFTLLAIVLLTWLPLGSALDAHTTTIATTGAEAVGISTATWNELSQVTLNNNGVTAFSATLQHDGSISASNDTGVWLFDGGVDTLLAQTGDGNVPGVVGADFSALGSASLSDTGEVVVSGSLGTGASGITTANNRGIWTFNSTSSALLSRTGTGGVASLPTANFFGYPSSVSATEFAHAEDGRVAVYATLAVGVGGVFSSNDHGLWTFDAGSSALISREGVLNVPDIPNASFNNYALPAINSSGQLAVLASLKTGGAVTPANASGIWLFSDSNAELIERAGSGNVPGVTGASFAKIRTPLLNDLGQVAFRATISSGGSISTGVWLYSDTSKTLLARSGDGNVPGIPDAKFHDFSVTSSLNNTGQVLTFAILRNGVGGVTSDNGSGLWLLGDSPTLIARKGIGNVPEIQGANFKIFSDYALNERGQVAFSAGLELGVGGIDSSNDSGIWIVDPLGESWLVAREGEQLAGRTIASLGFLGDDTSQSTGFNNAGELAFQATFTDGDSGLFLFRPYAADFDRDADVDVDDLVAWETAFATTSAADADNDDDSDGSDFLVWQREFGSGTALQPISIAVPEPASWLLLVVGLLGNRPRK